LPHPAHTLAIECDNNVTFSKTGGLGRRIGADRTHERPFARGKKVGSTRKETRVSSA